MADKRRDALVAKEKADGFLSSLLNRKRGGHRYPWWPYAAVDYRGYHIDPYLPRFISYAIRGARTVKKRGGRPSVVAVEVALRTGKRDEVIGEMTATKINGEWGIVPTKWRVLRIDC